MSTDRVPPWPSLYDPGLEILHIQHRNATQAEGAYLHEAKGLCVLFTVFTSCRLTSFSIPADIFRFTLYWTLAFYTPIFLICGSYAFWNFNFPPSPRKEDLYHELTYEIRPLPLLQQGRSTPPPKPPRENERRSRLAFALLVFLTFLIFGFAGAVVGSAVLGFIVTGLYRSANFNLST